MREDWQKIYQAVKALIGASPDKLKLGLEWTLLRRMTTTEWYVVAGQSRLAILRAPRYVDMFWRSFEIQPLTEPADPRLDDDAFWRGESWFLVDVRTNNPVSLVLAASVGLNRQQRRSENDPSLAEQRSDVVDPARRA